MKLHPINHDIKTTLWCGPGALATITGLPVSHVMAVLRHVTGRRTIKGVRHSDMFKAGAMLGLTFLPQNVYSYVENHQLPTLARWTKIYQENLASAAFLVNVSQHYVTVSGRKFNDNWTKSPVALSKAPRRRARVRAAWKVVKDPNFVPALPPAPPAPAKPASPNYSAKARALARKHGIQIEVGDPSPDCIYVTLPEECGIKDRHEGDHYVYDWAEALDRVKGYVEDLTRIQI